MNKQRRRTVVYALLGLLPIELKAACSITEPNALGPFYRRGAPFRKAIAEGEPGRRLHVSGTVLGSDGCTPLKGAIVDVWHANRDGRYYDVGADADSPPSRFRLRGRALTDEQGRYDFDTVVPGAYGVRPKHIHYVVSHPEVEPFVTQLYFEGDPRLANDFLARDSLVRPLETGADGSSRTRFDIVLRT